MTPQLRVACLIVMVGCATRTESDVVLPELCDASAAVAFDDRYWIVADDESNRLTVFDAKGEYGPVGDIDLGDLHEAFRGDEADLEGMAWIGDRLWVIGSHDAGKQTARREARHRLFGLNVTVANGKPVATALGQPRSTLLATQPDNAANAVVAGTAGFSAKDPRGLSIEGLAATPQGGLLVGFRTPIRNGRAAVLEVPNPRAMAEHADPSRNRLRWIDLDGKGIRSMEAADAGYLIVAGAADRGPSVLYRWAGDDTPPVRVPGTFGDLNPEAVFRFEGDWWALSDDGGVEIGGRKCKDRKRDERRFRARKLDLR